jgi:hypothetical protein
MTLLDAAEEHPPSRLRRYIIGGVVLALVAFFIVWYPLGLRFYKERSTVDQFMNELASGNQRAAYRTWKPSSAYSFQDFLEDWGANNGAAPIKSYKITSEQAVRNAPTAEIVVDVSPQQHFPAKVDASSRTREITLWVDTRDQSISFPPCGVGPNPRPCA